jgi:hypothetical protein
MICNDEKVASAMEDAIKKATNQAMIFAKEHPYYTALIAVGVVIAIGVLVTYASWVLEALGFAARGPRAGKSNRLLNFFPLLDLILTCTKPVSRPDG